MAVFNGFWPSSASSNGFTKRGGPGSVSKRHLRLFFTPINVLAYSTIFSFAAPALAEPASGKVQDSRQRPFAITEIREPCKDYNPLREPFFGDTHVHTAHSFDASSQDTRNKPSDAYRFAKGMEIGIQPYDANNNALRTIQLERPLDFTAVTDHSEFYGDISICMTPGTWGYWHPVCIAHRYDSQTGFLAISSLGLILKQRWGFCGKDNETCYKESRSIWQLIQEDAENAYDRSENCGFTSFVAYEWTASVGVGQNLHRNVIFRNEKVPAQAASWVETPSAFELWDYLEKDCVADIEGCEALTIPHNSNLSGGFFYETARVSSNKIPPGGIDAAEAKRRARWEPLHEIMQHKGSSECDSRTYWSADEFCDFEKLNYDRFGEKDSGDLGNRPAIVNWIGEIMLDEELGLGPRAPTANNFMRWALKEGLQQQQTLGANAFKFGIIGSTDSHLAAPGLTAEKGHPGHGGAGMNAKNGIPLGLSDDLEFNPGGLAVLWAEENTRDALFAAMQRKEAYGTSGTRPIVRFFAGWDFDAGLCQDPDMVAKAYAGGVPMGGDLPLPPASPSSQASSDPTTGQKPKFLVSALADPGTAKNPGTALQRIQIIKGWLDNGVQHEQVLDVAGGPNGAAVNTATCDQSGRGESQLCTVWQDPQFDASQQAFYYARVLENPSCRWSQYSCNAAKVNCADPGSVPEAFANCCSEDHKPVQQERAWTSPIWFTPDEQ